MEEDSAINIKKVIFQKAALMIIVGQFASMQFSYSRVSCSFITWLL